jgi:ABC-type antimicrobial peptide transport system permease subunit
VLDAPSNSVGLPDVLIDPSVVGPALDEFPVTQLFVATDGSSAAIERVRAAIQSVAPFAVIEPAGSAVSKVPQFAEVGRIVGIGLIGSLALAGCSLAVATITGLLQRRRQFALLRAAGLPMSRLRALVLIQSGVPLVVASAFSALLGVGVAQAILLLSPARTLPLPDVSLVLVLAGSVFVAMSVVAATLPGVDRLTRPQSIRSE